MSIRFRYYTFLFALLLASCCISATATEHLLSNMQIMERDGIGDGLTPMSGNIAGEDISGFVGPGIPIDPINPIDDNRVVTLMVRDYCGNHIYRNDSLERVLNDYGYRNAAGYHYYINDYQGNVRAVVDGSGTLEEVNSYYPYGALMGGGIANGLQPYKYGGKELDRQAGIDWYDSHARWYDSLIGRTPTQDRLAEKYYSISPYAWCASNPILFGDDNGEDIIIRGKNCSSVTFTTNLINLNVNAAKMGLDWGGNYTLQGHEVLSAGLDLAGIVDPTGVADATNAVLQANSGEWLNAAISVAGLIPYLGDAAKVGKVKKDINIIENAIDAAKETKTIKKQIHGNSKASTKAQHVYEIFETQTGKTVKTGISSGRIGKNGKSYRATNQVNRWNLELGNNKYDSKVIHEIPEGNHARSEALEFEKRNAQRLRHENQLDPKRHIRP